MNQELLEAASDAQEDPGGDQQLQGDQQLGLGMGEATGATDGGDQLQLGGHQVGLRRDGAVGTTGGPAQEDP